MANQSGPFGKGCPNLQKQTCDSRQWLKFQLCQKISFWLGFYGISEFLNR